MKMLIHEIRIKGETPQLMEFTRKMRNKATAATLSEVLAYAIKEEMCRFHKPVIELLLDHEDSEELPQIDEKIIKAIAEKVRISPPDYPDIDAVSLIFDQLDFVPNLFSRQVDNIPFVDFLIQIVLPTSFFEDSVGSFITEQLLKKEEYKSELLASTAKGLKLAVLLMLDSLHYQQDLQRIVKEVHLTTLSQPLFGYGAQQTLFEYSLERQKPRILELILDREDYRERLFTNDEEGFKNAAHAALITSKYHQHLKSIYQANRALLDKKRFGAIPQKNLLDYSIEEKNKSLVKLLLSDADYKKQVLGANQEGFRRAVKLAILDKDSYLEDLRRICQTPDIMTFLQARLFNINQLYDLETNEQIGTNVDQNFYPNRVEGQMAIDYVLNNRKAAVIDTLLSVDLYKKKLFDADNKLFFKRLLLLIYKVDKKYIKELKEIRSKLPLEVLNQKLFLTKTALENALSRLEWVLNNGEKEEQLTYEKVIDVLLQNDSLHLITKKAWKAALLLAIYDDYLEVLKKIRPQVSQELLDMIVENPDNGLEVSFSQDNLETVSILLGSEEAIVKPTITDRAIRIALRILIQQQSQDEKAKKDSRIKIFKKLISRANSQQLTKKIFYNNQTAVEYAKGKGASEEIINILAGSTSS